MTLVDDRESRGERDGAGSRESDGRKGTGRGGPRAWAAHPLRAEFLRGIAPWTGAALLLVLGVLLACTSRRWQGGWGETAQELHTALVIAVPLAVAAGCWQGGRERRRGTEELWATAGRGPLVRLAASALPVAFWLAVGYLAAAAAAMVATWPYAQGDRPQLASLPAGAVAVGAAALAGHVAGRLVPARPFAPLPALAVYAGLAWAEYASTPWSYLSPSQQLGGTVVPVWWQPVAMAAWTGGLAAAAALVYAARRRYTALLPLAAALWAALLLVQNGPALWVHNTLADRQVCDTSVTPAVCVNARYAGMLPQVTGALSGLTGRLEGVRHLPARWADRPGGPRADEVELPMLTPMGWHQVRGRLVDPQQYAWEALAALQYGDCPDTQDPHRAAVDDAVEHYLAPSPFTDDFDARDARGSAADRAELKARLVARGHLKAMGEAQRRAWLSSYFATTRDCDAKGVPAL
ncbi:hypothetical protein ACIPRD_26525 [Streptomyces sp. NPDC090108]|uniref:hypothetical protein n=1 Tax=Streptomyces sp. NPDC090108 TaxID=3365947 RepID=UPI00381F8AC0